MAGIKINRSALENLKRNLETKAVALGQEKLEKIKNLCPADFASREALAAEMRRHGLDEKGAELLSTRAWEEHEARDGAEE